MFTPQLPIDDVLPQLTEALQAAGRVVLMAPPGAGKTTRVPLALLPQVEGKILMLEPRRLAARSAAERMAQTLGEAPGETVGYRMRGASKTSSATRIEVVTEGILTRMLQSDPELTGVGAVIFDEFHERSLNADLGLALTWEVRQALRDDLQIVVMSATLDAQPVADLLDNAPVVRSEGRAFPVETRWLDTPTPKTRRFEQAVADRVETALQEAPGSALVFLPGEGEIRRVEALLHGRLPGDCALRPLYGAMKFADQRAAIAPCDSGRKVVLATAIAETSLTIEDVRIVVDGGRARRARFDPGSGMSRLVTERVSKAEAEQRRGRAGRVSEGLCYRLWTKGEEGALMAFPPRRNRDRRPDRSGAGTGALGCWRRRSGISDAAACGPVGRSPRIVARDRRIGCRTPDHRPWQGFGGQAAASKTCTYAADRRRPIGGTGRNVKRTRSFARCWRRSVPAHARAQQSRKCRPRRD